VAEVTITVADYKGAGESLKRIQELLFKGLAGGAVLITFGREKRSTDQNAKLWPMLSDMAAQVEWFGKKHTKEQWKDIVTGTFCGCEFVPNLQKDGFVMLGTSTSKMDKNTFGLLIEYIYAAGIELNVSWSEPALQAYEEYRESHTQDNRQ
tara:strand:+ start:738 stop:1190 length:453 start_codon:yes stop_codon:yes gene_type:complete